MIDRVLSKIIIFHHVPDAYLPQNTGHLPYHYSSFQCLRAVVRFPNPKIIEFI